MSAKIDKDRVYWQANETIHPRGEEMDILANQLKGLDDDPEESAALDQLFLSDSAVCLNTATMAVETDTAGSVSAVKSKPKTDHRRVTVKFTLKTEPVKKAEPPGAPLTMLRHLMGKRSYQRIVKPHILDMRHEHAEAISVGEFRKARLIVFRGYVQVLWPLFYGTFSTLVALWKLAK